MLESLNSDQQRMMSLFETLLAIGSPSGRETGMATWLYDYLTSLGCAPEFDVAGNLLVRLPALDPKMPAAILAAHMDEIGLVVTAISPDGSLRVDRSGGLAPHKLGERAVEIFGAADPVTAIVSFGNGHVAEGTSVSPSWNDVRLLTGLSVAQLEEKGIRPGAVAVPVAAGRGPFLLGDDDDPMIAAWTLDDRAGIVVLLELLRRLKEDNVAPCRPITIAFTVSEETGCHGAKFLAGREKPEFFIAVDGCPWSPDCGFDVDDRPTIWSKDLLAHYDQGLIVTLNNAAKAAGTRCQTAVLAAAYSDASAVYNNGGAPRVGLIGHARYNSHGMEVARLGAFSNVINTLIAFIAMTTW